MLGFPTLHRDNLHILLFDSDSDCTRFTLQSEITNNLRQDGRREASANQQQMVGMVLGESLPKYLRELKDQYWMVQHNKFTSLESSQVQEKIISPNDCFVQ